MYPHKNRLTLVILALLAFLAAGLPQAAWAQDDCSNSPAPAVLGGTKVGGYNSNTANKFNTNYANSAQQVVQKRGLAKFAMIIAADTIDAKAHYCWNLIKTAITAIGGAANIKMLIINAIIAIVVGIISNAIIQACQAALGAISSITAVLSNFASKLCLPIPKLQLPHFGIPAFGSAGTCNGIGLSSVLTLNGGTAGGQNKVYWKLWGKTQQQ